MIELRLNEIGQQPDVELRGAHIEAGVSFSVEEVERIKKGLTPASLDDDASIHDFSGKDGASGWNIDDVLARKCM